MKIWIFFPSCEKLKVLAAQSPYCAKQQVSACLAEACSHHGKRGPRSLQHLGVHLSHRSHCLALTRDLGWRISAVGIPSHVSAVLRLLWRALPYPPAPPASEPTAAYSSVPSTPPVSCLYTSLPLSLGLKAWVGILLNIGHGA